MSWSSVAIVALVAGALGGVAADDGYRRVLPGDALEFPRDHGAHPDTKTEWWYLTGNVEDEAGRAYGVQFTVFRSALGPPGSIDESAPLRTRQVWAGHLALADVAAGRVRFAERLRRGGTALAAASEDDMDIALDDWTLRRGADDALSVVAGDVGAGFAVTLSLRPEKPLVLHGDGGVSSKGPEPGNASAYSSWTRLAASGELVVDGEPRQVTGSFWYDHEFGSSVLGEGVEGWDWFGLQLDDGRELMLFHLRRADGPPMPASSGTLVARDGTATHLALEDFELTPTATWRSPRTDAVYPAAWTLRVPDHGVDVRIAPRVADCELDTSHGTGVVYWEGPVELFGSHAGRGYGELTGYAGSMGGRF